MAEGKTLGGEMPEGLPKSLVERFWAGAGEELCHGAWLSDGGRIAELDCCCESRKYLMQYCVRRNGGKFGGIGFIGLQHREKFLQMEQNGA